MSACSAHPFVHQSVASARLAVRLMIVYHCACWFIFRPSICLIFRPSVCMSVCMYVHMYLCRDERTSVSIVDIDNWIELTDTLSGLSLQRTLISFGCCFFVSRFKRRHCRYVHLLCKDCVYDRQKVHIYLWAITLFYYTSRLWKWRKVNPKPVITFYITVRSADTSNFVLKHIMTSLSDPSWVLRWKRCLDSSYVVHTGMFI